MLFLEKCVKLIDTYLNGYAPPPTHELMKYLFEEQVPYSLIIANILTLCSFNIKRQNLELGIYNGMM